MIGGTLMKKILIVDDEPMMLGFCERVLSPKYSVETAASGQEALEIYPVQQPDLVLSDLMMTDMTGAELKETLALRYGERAPVLFTVSDDSEVSGIQGFADGSLDYFKKPLPADVLLARIDSILDNSDKIEGLGMDTNVKFKGLLDNAAAEKAIGDSCVNDSGVFMLLDLDGLKEVGEKLGSESADKLVKAVTDIFEKNSVEGDILGKAGDERFVAFCRFQTDVSFPKKFTAALNEQIASAAKELPAGESLVKGVSAGAVFVPESGKEYASLYKLAEKALCSVKDENSYTSATYSQYSKFSEWRRDMKSASMLFDESDIGNGACRISTNGFGPVYRYFVRYVQSYCRSAFKMLFTLSCAKPPYQGMAFISERFSELIAQKLRKSDLLVQLTEDQFFLVLPEITEQDAHKLAQRILSVWSNSDFSDGIELQYEAQQIPINLESGKHYRSSDK